MTWLWRYDTTQESIEATIRNIDAIEEWPTHLHVPLGKGFPVVDIQIKRSSGPLPDFFPVGPLDIVSGRLKAVIERCGGHAEFLPVSIRGVTLAPTIGAYFYMRSLDELPCMDAKQSEFTMEDEFIHEIRRFVLDESIAKQRPMFQLEKSYLSPLFVSDELADALRAAKISGVQLLPPNTFTHY